MCVGRRIAEAEMQLATAHLCRKARVHLKRLGTSFPFEET